MLQNFFWRNYIYTGVTSVEIIGKYAASAVNYALKSFIILATGWKLLPGTNGLAYLIKPSVSKKFL